MHNPLRELLQVDDFIPVSRCVEIIDAAESYGKWTKNRHETYPTTDIPLKEIPGISFSGELAAISQLARTKYKIPSAEMRMFDLFVVKYTADGQDRLDLHRDVSVLSFVVLLSPTSDFAGGGTYYEQRNLTLRPEQGAVTIHCGKQRHAGGRVTAGTRYVLIGFIETKDRAIAPLLSEEKTVLHKVTDDRYFDFLWRRQVTPPLAIAVRVINMENRPARYQATLDTLNRAVRPESFEFSVTRIPASTGGDATAYAKWETTSFSCVSPAVQNIVKPYWSRPILAGELGCWRSHLDAIQLCDQEYVLVLEDDAEFLSDMWFALSRFVAELNGRPWDAIDLGAIPIDATPYVAITESLGTRGYCYQSHCILWSRAGISKMQRLNPRSDPVVPMDELLPALRAVHPRPDINALYSHVEKLTVYFPKERMAWQRGDGIHDSQMKSSLSGLVDHSTDLANYYMYRNVGGPEELQDLITKANGLMWNFTVQDWEPLVSQKFPATWGMDLTQEAYYRKITGLYFPPDVPLDGALMVHGGSGPRPIPIAPGVLVVFPAYFSFRLSGPATQCWVIRACGESFQ